MSASFRQRNYSEYTAKVCSLIGIPYSGMTSDEQGWLQQYLQDNLENVWGNTNWLDICPYGEARFVGNVGYYPNDLTKTAYWTATAITPTISTSVANPADGRYTVTQLLETTANSAHSVTQSATVAASTQYMIEVWARPVGGRYLCLYANDGTTTFYSFFNLATGTIGTSGNLTGTAQIVQQNNGFYLCQITLTTGSSASSLTYGLKTSTDGSTISFTGSASAGLLTWGLVCLQSSYANPTSISIPWNQTGENVIDVVYEVWKNSPATAANPIRQGYELNPDGIQIIGPTGWNASYYGYTPPAWYFGANPVYIYYRKQIPTYYGPTYSASSTYAVDDVVMFTNSAGVTNYWKCVVATTAGQSPDTTPASWSVQTIPDVFFRYLTYACYADWLRQDGQFDKANMMDEQAENVLATELDKQERQQGWVQPTRVYTHVTSQPRRF